MTNKQLIIKLTTLKLRAQQQERKERCRRREKKIESQYITYNQSTEIQYVYLTLNSKLYRTPFEKIIDHIKVCWLTYKASPNADLNTSLPTPYYWSFLPFEPVKYLTPDMIRIHQHIIATNEYIEFLSWNSIFDTYQSQEQKMMYNQYVRNTHLCVMTQICKKKKFYCRETSTDIISSLCPMPNFHPHKKTTMADEKFPSLVAPMTTQQQ